MSANLLVDTEESKNIAVVHKTNQGYSGKDLWKLKQERPELFGLGVAASSQDTGSSAGVPPPTGYEEEPRLGRDWLVNREKDLYLNRSNKKFYVRDTATNQLCEAGVGRDLTPSISVHGDAAAYASPGGASSRHAIINDLHRAASSMRLDFAHHDSPAAMFAVYDGKGNGPLAEAAAKGLHVRLLPRLAQHRGEWENERLEAAVSESIQALATELGAQGGLSLAVVLMIGGRLTIASSGGAVCLLFGRDGGSDGGGDDLDVVSKPGEVTVQCVVLEDSHLGALLTVDGVSRAPGLSGTRLRALVRRHVAAERPRAGCISLLGEARRCGAEVPVAACAVRFGWTRLESEGSAAKRARTEPTRLTKVRCRHILLRHSGATSQLDRGKPKSARKICEAEEMLLGLMPQVSIGGAAAFTAVCKKESDCDTNLRGGDLAGDLGWLDRDPLKNRKIPATVVRAAFTLAVGQLSDVVASDRGVHLLLRTA